MIENAISWKNYYEKKKNRSEENLLLEIPFENIKPGLAIDLVCGDGTETLALLRRDWHVLAIDQDKTFIFFFGKRKI